MARSPRVKQACVSRLPKIGEIVAPPKVCVLARSLLWSSCRSREDKVGMAISDLHKSDLYWQVEDTTLASFKVSHVCSSLL